MRGTSFLFACRSTGVVLTVSVIVLAVAIPGFDDPNVPQVIANAMADMLLRGINWFLPVAKIGFSESPNCVVVRTGDAHP